MVLTDEQWADVEPVLGAPPSALAMIPVDGNCDANWGKYWRTDTDNTVAQVQD